MLAQKEAEAIEFKRDEVRVYTAAFPWPINHLLFEGINGVARAKTC